MEHTPAPAPSKAKAAKAAPAPTTVQASADVVQATTTEPAKPKVSQESDAEFVLRMFKLDPAKFVLADGKVDRIALSDFIAHRGHMVARRLMAE